MPHFIIDCSSNILDKVSAEEIMDSVYDTASNSGLFAPNDVKIRLRPFEYYRLGESKDSFVHVFAYIMEGRSVEQKAELSQSVITELNNLLADVSFLSMNIYDFEFETYCNKSLIDPENAHRDRHYKI